MQHQTARPATTVDDRPWGQFRQYAHNAAVTVKVIDVQAGQALSLQRHRHRDELWVALDEGLVAEVGDAVIRPTVGEEIWIPRDTVHRIRTEGRRARFLEVAFGHFDEDDIERLEDAYGRS